MAAAPGTSNLCDLLAALSPRSVTGPGGLYAEMQLSAAASQVGPALRLLPSPNCTSCCEMSPPNSWRTAILRFVPCNSAVFHCQAASARPRDAAADGPREDKVAAVCAAFRAAMLAAGQRQYLGPILTSHAKQGDLEAALAIVKQLKEEELAASQAQRQLDTSSKATVSKASTANGVSGHENGHAAVAYRDAVQAQAGPADDASRAATAAVGTAAGHEGAVGAADSRKSWTAEDGLRHLLLYSDVDKLYRCRALRPGSMHACYAGRLTALKGFVLGWSSRVTSVSSGLGLNTNLRFGVQSTA